MRRFADLLLLAAAAALLPASKADAYKLFKHRWYSKTLTYYDATGGRYKEQIKAAASVLNRSGARIRVRSASRRSARVRIGISRNLRSRLGEARYKVRGRTVRSARILVRPTSRRAGRRRRRREMATIAVFAHEMAHVLGLNHENRRCATMNSTSGRGAHLPRGRLAVPLPDPRGRRRARPRAPLRRAREERRAGAVRGRAGTGGAARAGRGAGRDGVGQTWLDRGRRAAVSHRGPAQGGGCPTGNEDTTATLVARIESGPGQAKSIAGPPAGAGQLLLRGRGHRPARAAWDRRHGDVAYWAAAAANFTADMGRPAAHAAAADGHLDRP